MQATDRDKYGNPEDKTTQNDLLEAEEWKRKFLSQPMTRAVTSSKGFTHRTLVKVN